MVTSTASSRVGYLKVVFLALFLLVLVTNVAVNFRFNMTGYGGNIPGVDLLSSFAEQIKTYVFSGNQTHNAINRSLFLTRDLENLLKNNASPKLNKKNISVLFYNSPGWTSVNNTNSNFKQKCVYSNCELTTNLTDIQSRDAIIFSPHEPMPSSPPIQASERRPDQVWIMFGFEAPVNFVYMGYRHASWQNTINWTMAYRINSDIFYPYALLTPNPHVQEKDYSAIFHKKAKSAAWIVSHCHAESLRDEYVQEMQAAGLQVDIYGKCGKLLLKGTNLVKTIQTEYKFYLAFENSFCIDYVTEKYFKYYNWDVILVVRGGANYSQLFPEGTFINTADFRSPRDLVQYLQKVERSEELFTSYLKAMDKYTVFTDTGSLAYCSLCEKLNNLDENRKTIDDHITFMHKDVCWTPSDMPFHLSAYGLSVLYCIIFVFVILTCYFLSKQRL